MDLGAAIVQGYANYWYVRIAAIRDPADTTVDLESVMAGNELVGARKTLARLRAAGEAGDTTVKHLIWITSASPEEAVVVDRYTAETIQLDPNTKAPLNSEPLIQHFADRFLLRNIDGAWKVVQEEPEQ
jgi:hypothetical protein